VSQGEGDPGRPRIARFLRWLAADPWWAVAVVVVVPTLRLLYRWRLIGTSNIPAAGPALVASNHVSPLDPFAIGLAGVSRRRAIRYVASAEFFDWPVGGFLLRRIRMVPIRRGGRDIAALDAAAAMLGRGELVGIFPEGGIGPGDALQRGRSGAARLGLRTGVPIIPVAVWGPQRRWGRGGPRFGGPPRPRATVAVGEPILLPGPHADPTPAEVDALTRRIMAGIAQALDAAQAAS